MPRRLRSIRFLKPKSRTTNDSEPDFVNPKPCSGVWARQWRRNHDTSWKQAFTPFAYYEHLRKEIEREDSITNQRLTSSISIQTFFMAAVVFLVSGAWPEVTGHPRIILFRLFCLILVGFAALIASFITLMGVSASREHSRRVKKDWIHYNSCLNITPEMAPHAFGHGPKIKRGGGYAYWIPCAMVFMWTAYLAIFWLTLGKGLVVPELADCLITDYCSWTIK